jgi:hypothetical protein
MVELHLVITRRVSAISPNVQAVGAVRIIKKKLNRNGI